MNYYFAVKPNPDPFSRTFDNLSRTISPQQGMMLLACLGLVGLIALVGGSSKKGKLAKGYFGDRLLPRERIASTDKPRPT